MVGELGQGWERYDNLHQVAKASFHDAAQLFQSLLGGVQVVGHHHDLHGITAQADGMSEAEFAQRRRALGLVGHRQRRQR